MVDGTTPPGGDSDFYSFFTDKVFGSLKQEGSLIKTAFESLVPLAKTTLNVFQQVDAEAVKVAKSFGQGRENVLSIKQTLVDAAPAVAALGGKFESVGKIQQDLVSTLNRAVLLSSESYASIFAATQVTNQEAGELFTKFKDIGVSAYGVADGMQKIVNVARQQGLSVEAVSKQALNNMEAMNKYTFQGGVDGLAKMAAQASSLRINMGTTLKFAEDLYNPEKAIDMAASLQRLGVAQSDLLDPLRLMDLSLNDPTELQNQLVQMTQQFVELNEAGQFEIAPQGKLQLREIEKATGIAYSELTKMALGSAELEDKLSRIRFPDTMTEDQQKMIANLAEMKDGEYVIQVGNQQMKLEDALKGLDTREEFDKLIAAAEPKTMEELTREQLSIQDSMRADIEKIRDRVTRGLATSEVGEETANAMREGFKGLTDAATDKGVLSAESFRTLADKEGGAIGDVLSKLLSGNVNVFEDLTAMGEGFKEFGTTTLEGLKENFTEQYAKMLESNNKYAEITSSLIGKMDEVFKQGFGFSIVPQLPSAADVNVAKTTDAAKTQSTTEEKKITTSSTVDVNISLDVPPGMSETDVMKAIQTQQIKEEIVKVVREYYPDLKTKPD